MAVNRMVFNVAVVGLNATDSESSGLNGVGKSCLCNRFVRPSEDDYYTDHSSVLSQVDFGSRVINNEHWLYWGERQLPADNKVTLRVRVIEQTEFIDDESFQPLRSNAFEPYLTRCLRLKLHSPDKLVYICKNQLAFENEYTQETVPDGHLDVHGFICVYDVSRSNAEFQRQADYVSKLLVNIGKLKKPVVLVTTKNDLASKESLKYFANFLNRKEFKTQPNVVGSSAHQHVNTDHGFLILSHLIHKSAPRITRAVLSYKEACAKRTQLVESAQADFLKSLRDLVQDHTLTYAEAARRVFAGESSFLRFHELCGHARAQRLFAEHQKELCRRHAELQYRHCLKLLPKVLEQLLPELTFIQSHNWSEMIVFLQSLPTAKRFFSSTTTLASCSANFIDTFEQLQPEECFSNTSSGCDFLSMGKTSVDSSSIKIPLEVLYSAGAEQIFLNHVQHLEEQSRQQDLESCFLQLLASCSQVTPGKPLDDARIFLMGNTAYESLSPADTQRLYDFYQNDLVQRAETSFQELLLENVNEFLSRSLFSSTPVSDTDMVQLHSLLQEDSRYRQMSRLHVRRDKLICQYISFLRYPLCQHCFFGKTCVDSLCDTIYSTAIQKSRVHNLSTLPRIPVVDRVNVIILGADGLDELLFFQFQNYLSSVKYTCKQIINMCFVSIDDVGGAGAAKYLQSLFAHEQKSHEIIGIYGSRSSFRALNDCLLNCVSLPDMLPFHVSLLMARDPRHFEDLPLLQQQGIALAKRLQCSFFAGGSETSSDVYDQLVDGMVDLFSEAQIRKCLESITDWHSAADTCSTYTSEPLPAALITASISEKPDIRILICLTCGDDFPPDVVLAPFLQHSCGASPSTPTPQLSNDKRSLDRLIDMTCLNSTEKPSFAVSVFLPSISEQIRASVTAAASHSAFWISQNTYYSGYVLVYSTKRKASLMQTEALAHLVPEHLPLLILAVGEVAEFFSDNCTQSLIVRGNAIADRTRARFTTVSKTSELQIGVFTAFLEDVWLRQRACNGDYGTSAQGYVAKPRIPLTKTAINTVDSEQLIRSSYERVRTPSPHNAMLSEEKPLLNGSCSPKKATPRKLLNKKTSARSPHSLPPVSLMELSQSSASTVPLLIMKCTEHIEEIGLLTEGLYRVPGNQVDVDQLLRTFSENGNVAFKDLNLPVNVVATALKNFFCNLEQPIILPSALSSLVQIFRQFGNDVSSNEVRLLLQKLPSENLQVLQHLFCHLRKIAQHSKHNSMDHRNLARCWWPTLMRPHFDNFEEMLQMTNVLENVLLFMLDNYECLF